MNQPTAKLALVPLACSGCVAKIVKTCPATAHVHSEDDSFLRSAHIARRFFIADSGYSADVIQLFISAFVRR
jgi:hypothetical protein